jgi:hypothetical protein
MNTTYVGKVVRLVMSILFVRVKSTNLTHRTKKALHKDIRILPNLRTHSLKGDFSSNDADVDIMPYMSTNVCVL